MTFRAILAAFVLCVSAWPAWAADYTFAPAPAWVQAAPLPDAGDALPTGDGTRYLLLDDQVDTRGRAPVWYRRIASRLDNARALSDGGQIEIAFQPDYQRVRLHAIHVWRGGTMTDRRRDARIEVLRREEDLDAAIYDGEHTLSVTVPDLRVGDIVDYSFSIVGGNPVFGATYHDSYAARFGPALGYRRVRALYPVDRPLHASGPKDFVRREGALGDARFVEFTARRLPRTRIEPDTPDTFDSYGRIELSTAANWGDVVRWAWPMYVPRLQDRVLAAGLVRSLKLDDPDKRAAMLRAIAFVENEIRYTALDMGKNSHEPNRPETVIARRFGDCKDKAVLLSALLHEAGIAADPVLVDTEAREAIATRLPSAYAFDHVVVRAHLDGKPVWIDPTRDPEAGPLEDRSPLPFRLGLPLCDTCDRLVAIPQPMPRAPEVDVGQRIDLVEDGSGTRADFTVVTDYRNERADDVRQDFADADEDVGSRYLRYMRNYYDDLRSIGAPALKERAGGGEGVRSTERYALHWKAGEDFRIVLFQLLDWLPDADLDARTSPLLLDGPAFGRQTIRTYLGGGWDIAPETDVVANKYFAFRRTVRASGSRLDIVGEWRRMADQVPPADYAKVRGDIARVRALMAYDVAIGGEAIGDDAPRDDGGWRIVAIVFFLLSAALAWLAFHQATHLRRHRAAAGGVPPNRS